MLKVAICDDERYFQGQLDVMVDEIAKVHKIKIDIDIFDDGIEIVKQVRNGHRFDIIFMDIQMKQMNGIEAAVRIREADKAVQLIYVTSFQEYVYDVFKVAPIGFLLKPIKKEKLEKIFLNAAKYIINQDVYYRFEYKKVNYRVLISDILYFQSNLRDIDIVCENVNYKQSGNFTKVEEQLSKCNCEFLRIHRSYLVNQRYIRKFTRENIILADDSVLPIGKTYKTQLLKL